MITLRSTEFYVSRTVRIVNCDPELRFGHVKTWAIRGGHHCMNNKGEWEYEPTPSNRDDEFLDRCRFTLEQAKEMVVRLKLEESLALREELETLKRTHAELIRALKKIRDCADSTDCDACQAICSGHAPTIAAIALDEAGYPRSATTEEE